MPSDPSIRAGDADRERVAEQLREHYAQGRLDADELDERLSAVLSARTVGELRALTADLPPPEPYQLPVPASSRHQPVHRERHRPPARAEQALRAQLASYGSLVAICVVVWALTGFGYFWPVWIIAPWGIVILGHVIRGHRL